MAVIDYDKSPNITPEQRLKSLADSVRRAFEEIETSLKTPVEGNQETITLDDLGGYPKTGGTIEGNVNVDGKMSVNEFIITGKTPLLFKDSEALEATKQHLGIGANDIVEEGTTEDGWSYIKYASGLAEMWFRGNIGQVTLGTVLGTDVVSNPFSINFPFSFIKVPYCVVTYEGNSTGYAGVQMVNGNNTTVSKSYGIRLVRMGNSSIALQDNIVSCYARGSWQTGEETTLTATHDGVGNVTVYGVTATHDGAGNVRIL